MSAYDNDRGVSTRDCGCCFDVVQPDGRVGKAAPGMVSGFVGCSDGVEPNGLGFNTMDEAIRPLIGDPQ